jgi:hypothetical protein
MLAVKNKNEQNVRKKSGVSFVTGTPCPWDALSRGRLVPGTFSPGDGSSRGHDGVQGSFHPGTLRPGTLLVGILRARTHCQGTRILSR